MYVLKVSVFAPIPLSSGAIESILRLAFDGGNVRASKWDTKIKESNADM